MAMITGRSRRTGKVRSGAKVGTTTGNGLWTTHNPSSGLFLKAKKTGGAFKGIRREG
jgi:hypothetical protein